VRATVFEVRKVGSRVKVILSRIRPHLVQRLFEQEFPKSRRMIEIGHGPEPGAAESGGRQRVRVDCVGRIMA
jgi:N utilization substance protein A